MWYKLKVLNEVHGYTRYYDLIYASTYLDAWKAAKELKLPKDFIVFDVEPTSAC